MNKIVNDKVCEFIKNELKDEGIIIDVNDNIIHKIIKQYVGCSEEFLLDDEGLEYEGIHGYDFDSIPRGRWLNNDGSINKEDHVYIYWYNFNKHFIDPLKRFYNNKLSEYADDYELYD